MTDFDPSVEAQQTYRDSGMSASQYYVMKSRWLKDSFNKELEAENKSLKYQAAKQGRPFVPSTKTYKPGWLPKGYQPTWISRSVENPTSVYYKPDAYAKYRPDLPDALWDMDKDVQNYWHDPTNIVSWYNRLRVQDDDYEPPDGVDKSFIKSQYNALKDFNDDEDNPLFWNPLPIGHEAAYLTNFQIDPTDNMAPIVRSVNSLLTKTPRAYPVPPEQQRYEEQIALAQQFRQAEDIAKDKDLQNLYIQANTAPDAASALEILKGNIPDTSWEALKLDFYKQGKIPDDNGDFVTRPDPRPSYFDLEPWQRGVQTLTGQAGGYKDTPPVSSEISNAISTVMPALGLFSSGTQLAGTVLALGSTNPLSAIPGAVAATAIELATATLTGLSLIYLTANKDNINDPTVRRIMRISNSMAEAEERLAGTIRQWSERTTDKSNTPEEQEAANWEAQGLTASMPFSTTTGLPPNTEIPKSYDEVEPFDFRAAYDAAYLTYELYPEIGNGDWLLDTVSKAANAWDNIFGTNLSSGLTTKDDEVWKFNEGISTPVKVDGGLGTPKMREAYEVIKALGEKRTRAQLEEIWNYYINLSGTGGMLSDIIAQSFNDPAQLIPFMTDAAIADGADALSKHYTDIKDPYKATMFRQLSNAAEYAMGNPLIDMLPIGAQQAAQWAANKFESIDQYIKYRSYSVEPGNYFDFVKSNKFKPTVRGSLMLPDTMNLFNALRNTGYMMPGGSEFILHPGGNTNETLRFYTAPDGSLTMKNSDGTQTFWYDKSQLDNLGVKFSVSPDGELLINNMKAVLSDAGFDTSAVPDNVSTGINWQDVGGGVEVGTKPVEAEAVDATDAEFGEVVKPTPEAPEVYTATINNKVYTANADTNVVTKVTDLSGKELEIVRPIQISPKPIKIAGDVLTQADADAAVDLTVLTATVNKPYLNPDYKPASQIKTEGILGKIASLGKVGEAIVNNFDKLINLTPGTKALLFTTNFQRAIAELYNVSGGNFVNQMNALNRLANGTDTGEVTRVAEEYMNQSATIAATIEAFKIAFGDKGIANNYAEMYKDSTVSRALIAKWAKAAKVSPNKLIEMSPETILTKLKNKLAPMKDEVSRAMLNEIANGTLSADRVGNVIKPFTGEDAIPVTDRDFVAAVQYYADKAIQDYTVKKFGVTKLPFMSRLMGLRKAFLAPQFIEGIFSTMVNNALSNIGVQIFMTGGVPIYRSSSIKSRIEAYGIVPPYDMAGKEGLTSLLLDSVSKIASTMNPNDSLAKATKNLRKLTKFLKLYGMIEKYNTSALFVKEIENYRKRIPLEPLPVNVRSNLLATGMTPFEVQLFEDMMDAAKNPQELLNNFIAGKEYDAIDVGLIRDAAKDLAVAKPEYAPIYEQLGERLGLDDEFMAKLKDVTTDEQVDALREDFSDGVAKAVDTMLDANTRAEMGQVAEKLDAEGMIAGVEIFMDVIGADWNAILTNTLRWDDAWVSVLKAEKAGDFRLKNAIFRQRIKDANRIFRWKNALQTTKLKAMIETLQVSGDKAKPFIDEVVKRNEVSTRTMAQIAKNIQSWVDGNNPDRESRTKGLTKWEEVSAKNEDLTNKLHESDAKAIESILNKFIDMLNAKVVANAAASGLTVDDVKAGAVRIKKNILTGFATLRNLIDNHYKEIKGLDVQERRAISAVFWNDKYTPTLSKMLADLYDNVRKEFHTARTDVDRELFPNEPPTVPDRQIVTPPTPAENVQAHIAKRELFDTATAAVDEVHNSAVEWYESNLPGYVKKIEEGQPPLPFTLDEAKVTTPEVKPLTPEEIVERTNKLIDTFNAIENSNSKSDKSLVKLAKEALALYEAGANPVLENLLSRIDKRFEMLDEVPEGEAQPSIPAITMQPLGSTPIVHNIGASIAELYELQLSDFADNLMGRVKQRLKASERPKYKLKFNPAAAKIISNYLPRAAENIRLRNLAILEAAERTSKDLMIDYSRIHGFDKLIEQAFPFQFWFTRSALLWLKRVVSAPGIAAFAYRYRELQRRNTNYGFPSRMQGKNLFYAPWLSEGFGDVIGFDLFGKVYTGEQLFRPVQNYANLDADITTEAQNYIIDLAKQEVISMTDATAALKDKKGTIWDDAVGYVKLNTMKDKTDPVTLVGMMMSLDPYINAAVQVMRGTPENISPFPLTRQGNALEAVWGKSVIGIVGGILSYPEDTIRKLTGLPELGEWTDYYVDFWLSNMAVEGRYDVDDIKKAMISREGAIFEEAKYKASLYIAYRAPFTALGQVIQDGHTDPQTLASAFLMSFLPAGVFPDGEMELRGLKDEYSQAWKDYMSGDKEALEKFDEQYPEYATRMMMFQEPDERLRGHLISAIWDAYTKLPSANKQIASETLGGSFQAYFLSPETRNYEKIDENTLTTWARKLGYQAPATPETEQAATQTVEPMKYYPEDTAATIQTFIDERKTKFPNYFIYTGVLYDLPKNKQEAFKKKYPIIDDYLDWKKAYAESNPTIKSYLEDRANKDGSYDTEYDVDAVKDYVSQFDSSIMGDILYHQWTGNPLSSGTLAGLNKLFIDAGKPGGDFKLWLRVLLNE